MKYAYYPGCSLKSTASEYDKSFQAVCRALDIEIAEPEDWICCGASSAHAVSRLLSVSLPASNMLKAEKMGAEEMIVPCAACFSRLKFAEHEIKEDPKMKDKVGNVLKEPAPEKIKVVHPLEIMEKVLKTKKPEIKRKTDLRIACYYGCLLARPPKVTEFDDCEYPMSMDNALRKMGYETIDWSYKTDCCGAAFGLSDSESVKKLIRKILDNAIALGADAIAVACPMCHANLDLRQGELGNERNLPIVYFTQLMGLSLGLNREELSLESHISSTKSVVEKM